MKYLPKFSCAAVALTLACSFNAANALVQDAGTLSSIPATGTFASVSGVTFPGTALPYFDVLNFHVGATSVVSLNYSNLTNINFIGGELFYGHQVAEPTPTSPSLGTFWGDDLAYGNVTGNTFAGLLNPLTLTSGDYHIEFVGNLINTATPGNSSFSYSLSAAPVPEPSSIAMFLAGLGLVGVLAARRRQIATLSMTQQSHWG